MKPAIIATTFEGSMRHATLLFLALSTAGCQRTTCGEGTLHLGGECVPAELLDCGPGTVQIGDACLPEQNLGCGEGTVQRGDECIAVDEEWVHLPFAVGTTVTVAEGNHGRLTHTGSAVYALDFPAAEGTEVAAVRAGRVHRIREDSDSGCADASCADQANYVIIDHGDGTLASYYQLQLDGALVEVGDVVDRGQIIALSGNTGWSARPHLHLQINDLLYQSLPVRFEDLRDTSDGMAFGRDVPFTSTNTRQAPDTPPRWSTCPEDLFLWLGVRLSPGLPCTAAVRDRPYEISGVQFGVFDEAVWATSDGSWDYRCTETSAGGAFSGSLVFDGARAPEVLIAGAGEGDCTLSTGWPYSPRITILDE
jgi:hypothetical protein